MSIYQYNEISRLLLAYSAGHYHEKGNVSGEVDDLDMIISGINMLGEELQSANVSRDFFLSIFNTVADLVFVVDKTGIIVDVNKAVEISLKAKKDQIVDQAIGEYMSSVDTFATISSQLDKEPEPIYFFESTIEKERKQLLIGYCTATKLFNRAGEFNGYLIVVKNVTKQKQNEQMILQAIISAQQKEQKRVADDLHDSLGQELSMTKLMLSNLQKFSNANREFDTLLNMCKEMLDDSIAHLREVCFDLMPNVLIQGGLPIAIKSLVLRLESLDKIDVKVQIESSEHRLSRDLEIVIYRLVQEFINNMIKHSEATKLFVNLSVQNDEMFVVELDENGQGFDTLKLDKPRENRGYRNMKSNVKAFGGKFSLTSSAETGTKLIVKFPITNEEE